MLRMDVLAFWTFVAKFFLGGGVQASCVYLLHICLMNTLWSNIVFNKMKKKEYFNLLFGSFVGKIGKVFQYLDNYLKFI